MVEYYYVKEMDDEMEIFDLFKKNEEKNITYLEFLQQRESSK